MLSSPWCLHFFKNSLAFYKFNTYKGPNPLVAIEAIKGENNFRAIAIPLAQSGHMHICNFQGFSIAWSVLGGFQPRTKTLVTWGAR